MVLGIDKVLFERDDKGELIPKEVELIIDEEDEFQLPYKDETVFMIPLTRGEIKKMFLEMDKAPEDDADGKLISSKITNPKIEKDRIGDIPKVLATILVNTILHYSGLKVGISKKESIKAKEDEFGKN